ncbi:MAG TPA: hypothetical protein VFA04_11950 [Bryobacteraceae bacterium]|nr:hypothetical protein [Bryobacteraceae bacterium]
MQDFAGQNLGSQRQSAASQAHNATAQLARAAEECEKRLRNGQAPDLLEQRILSMANYVQPRNTTAAEQLAELRRPGRTPGTRTGCVPKTSLKRALRFLSGQRPFAGPKMSPLWPKQVRDLQGCGAVVEKRHVVAPAPSTNIYAIRD